MTKQTRIIVTISDRRCDVEFIRSLHEAGADVVRLNTAHQSPEDTLKVVRNVREVSEAIGIMIDTKGPEVRTRGIAEDLKVAEGDIVRIVRERELPSAAMESGTRCFAVSFDGFVGELSAGNEILIDDGLVSLTVLEKKAASDGEPEALVCRVNNSGTISNKRSVNIPGVHLSLPSLTEKDREYLRFAVEYDIDFIAHSFVRNRKDMEDVLEELRGSRVKVIAKIENREGVDNIEEILDLAYGIMVARGDLGMEIPYEEVPLIQKRLIREAQRRARPVITATQLLHTMIDNPRPTRAEVSDIANAICDGTDAVMLSGESAYGKYPVEAVRTLARIACKVETSLPPVSELPVFTAGNRLRNYLAKSAVTATTELPVKAVVIDTETGHSARIVAAYRCRVPVYAKSPDLRVVRELSVSYGICPSFMKTPETTDGLVENMLTGLLEEGKIGEEDLVVVLAGTPFHSKGSNFIEINTVSLCLHGRKRAGRSMPGAALDGSDSRP